MMSDSVLARVAALKTMFTPALKAMWRDLFETEPPPYNRRFLESRLAYRIQELAYGGLKPETIKRLEAIAEDLDGGDPARRRRPVNDRPIAGTRLIREWQGVEHCVIGERIRDKFAASRKKGMWMGGWAPLGYDVKDRKLVVNETDAATVRMIFHRFLRVGSMTKLTAALRSEGMRTKGGKLIDKGYLYRVLGNRVYLGEAVHKGIAYPGEHAAIVERPLWDRVHDIIQDSPRKHAMRTRAQMPALLKGLIFGPTGAAMTPSHTRRNHRTRLSSKCRTGRVLVFAH